MYTCMYTHIQLRFPVHYVVDVALCAGAQFTGDHTHGGQDSRGLEFFKAHKIAKQEVTEQEVK